VAIISVSQIFAQRAAKVSEAALIAEIWRVMRLMHVIGLFAGAVLAALSSVLVFTLFGRDFAGAGPVLVILGFTGWLAGLGMARGIYLIATGRTQFYLMSVTLGLGVNIAGNIILIPSYGGIGAAVATLVSQWVAVHASCYLVKDIRKIGNLMLVTALPWTKRPVREA